MTTKFLVNYNISSQFQCSRLVLKLDFFREFFFFFKGRVQNAARQDLIKYLYFITVIYLAQYVLSHGSVWIQGMFSLQTARPGKFCVSPGWVESSQ